jgi:ribosomal protein L32
MEYIIIKNWKQFQHYKDRNPPWIKLYHSLLDDYEYSQLNDASKLLLLSLWMLAGRTDNKIPNDLSWIKSKSMLNNKIDLKPLINNGFISINGDASKVLASDKQNDTQRREETKTKKKYLECVFLKTDQLEKLVKEHGKRNTDCAIEILNNYKMANGKKYKSDYHAIINWAMEKAMQKAGPDTSQTISSIDKLSICKKCGQKKKSNELDPDTGYCRACYGVKESNNRSLVKRSGFKKTFWQARDFML